MQTRAWVYFWLVGLVWGSSFLLIRVGVTELHPFHVVFIRTGIAAIGLGLVLVISRRHIPRDWRVLRSLVIIGIGNTAIPFTLLSIGLIRIDSGLSSVLQSTAALFSLVIAHFAFADERINPRKVAGLLAGFVGVVILASRSWQDGQLIIEDLAGQLMVVGASLCYATFTTYSRRTLNRTHIEPIVLSGIAMMSAALGECVLIFVTAPFGTPLTVSASVSSDILWAVIGLGVVNTFFAYLMYYSVVNTLGVARASMVTYIVPVVGLALGVLFLNEVIDIKLILGAALIFTGIGIVNLNVKRWTRRKQQAVVTAPETTQST